ncbi:MAG: IcmT/TraK family protein [Alphaproteobacteria bacterium]|nr:IcmT/TraK family protein [Alphaproteobacteria bacterium]
MVKELENLEAKMNWHWRDTMRTVRFLSFDGRCALLVPVWLFYLRWSTIIISFIIFYVFRFFENKGLRFPSALRAFRSWMVGRKRSGLLGVQKHRFIDYG